MPCTLPEYSQSVHGVSTHPAGLYLQPPWRLTIVSQLFRRFLAAYNSHILTSNTTSGVTIFEVTDPRFVLERKESTVVKLLFVADAFTNTERVWLL